MPVKEGDDEGFSIEGMVVCCNKGKEGVGNGVEIETYDGKDVGSKGFFDPGLGNGVKEYETREKK